MIVDDSETNLVLLEAVLKDKGYVVQTARSAVTAMEMLNTDKPDLILLDLLMPGINGKEMLKKMKSNDRLRNIPVIVVSAVADRKTREYCFENGASDYMTKPVKIRQLIAMIQENLD